MRDVDEWASRSPAQLHLASVATDPPENCEGQGSSSAGARPSPGRSMIISHNPNSIVPRYPPGRWAHTLPPSSPGLRIQIPGRGPCATGRWGCSGRIPGRRRRLLKPPCNDAPTHHRTPILADRAAPPPSRRNDDAGV